MMSLAHLYADFSDMAPSTLMMALSDPDEVVQDAQLSGFDAGYAAGWDDALTSQSKEQQKLTGELVQNMQDLSFTYHEAFAKLCGGMQPLMAHLVTSVLPNIASDGLALQLVDQIEKLTSAYGENTIELVASPETHATLSDVLTDKISLPFVISENSALGAGQVFLRVNDEEREIDTDAVLADIRYAIEAFFQAAPEALKYG